MRAGLEAHEARRIAADFATIERKKASCFSTGNTVSWLPWPKNTGTFLLKAALAMKSSSKTEPSSSSPRAALAIRLVARRASSRA